MVLCAALHGSADGNVAFDSAASVYT
jgi:hypothetical protein